MFKNLISVVVVVLFLLAVGSAVKNVIVEGGAHEISAGDIGSNLFSNFLLPFEVLALLLTAAVVGAILISSESEVLEKAEKNEI